MRQLGWWCISWGSVLLLNSGLRFGRVLVGLFSLGIIWMPIFRSWNVCKGVLRINSGHAIHLPVPCLELVCAISLDKFPLKSLRRLTWSKMLIDDLILVGGLEYFLFPIYWEYIIIPTDELMFFRGVGQPPTSYRSYRIWQGFLLGDLRFFISTGERIFPGGVTRPVLMCCNIWFWMGDVPVFSVLCFICFLNRTCFMFRIFSMCFLWFLCLSSWD